MLFKCRTILKTFLRWSNRLLPWGLSILLICLDYWLQNIKFPYFDNLIPYSLIEYYFPNTQSDIKFYNDSVFCVNIAHDKALTTYADRYEDIRGNDDITDRDSLLKFLNIAAKSNYKYLFLDVRLSKNNTTPTDSALFETLLHLKNIAVSTHKSYDEYELADERLKPITGYADYGVTLTTGFSRYEFLQEEGPSVALKMYRELDHNDIVRDGYRFYNQSPKYICINAPFIPLPQLDRDTIDIDGSYVSRYPYLGSELFRNYSEDALIKQMNGKYILIGDFDRDLHGTYIGDIPGPMLSLISYKFLKEGKHKYPISLLLLYFISYGTIFVCILCPQISHTIKGWLSRNIGKRLKISTKQAGKLRWMKIIFKIIFILIKLVLNIIGWSIFFSILAYKIFDIAFISLLPNISILIVSYIVQQIKSSR